MTSPRQDTDPHEPRQQRYPRQDEIDVIRAIRSFEQRARLISHGQIVLGIGILEEQSHVDKIEIAKDGGHRCSCRSNEGVSRDTVAL